MATLTTRPSALQIKKKIQLRPYPVYKNIINREHQSSNTSVTTNSIQTPTAKNDFQLKHKLPTTDGAVNALNWLDNATPHYFLTRKVCSKNGFPAKEMAPPE